MDGWIDGLGREREKVVEGGMDVWKIIRIDVWRYFCWRSL